MGLNILLVDDSDVIRAMIARTIRLAELPVDAIHEAANGREALEVLDERWIDLVLADLNMPVMNGTEMLHRMRENPQTANVPVVVVSTEGAVQRIQELTAGGVSAWVRKPFTPEEIRDVILKATEDADIRAGADIAVENIFCNVIETFAFAFPEECKDPDADPGDDIVRADIAFRGAVVGSLSIAAPAGLCNEMAANILGVDADDSEALRRGPDTLAELANITAGHLCTQLDPHRTTYLEPPVAARMEPHAWAGLTESDHCRRFTVEDHVLALQLRVRTPIQVAS